MCLLFGALGQTPAQQSYSNTRLWTSDGWIPHLCLINILWGTCVGFKGNSLANGSVIAVLRPLRSKVLRTDLQLSCSPTFLHKGASDSAWKPSQYILLFLFFCLNHIHKKICLCCLIIHTPVTVWPLPPPRTLPPCHPATDTGVVFILDFHLPPGTNVIKSKQKTRCTKREM